MITELKSLLPVFEVLPPRVRPVLENAVRDVSGMLREIILRSGREVSLYINSDQYLLSAFGKLCKDNSTDLIRLSPSEITQCFNSLCGYSVYSHINEIKEGFITIRGGHRAAVSGTAVVSSGEILNIRDISTISLRIAREVRGCAEIITDNLLKEGGGLLLCGSPSSGKTTVLRDTARLLSAVYKKRTSLVDTRGEIASTSHSVPMNDIGLCDVLDGYPRAKGIEQAVRCFSPEYVICDEIGSFSDLEAIEIGINSGVDFVATVHASCKDELMKKQGMSKLLATGAFSQVVFLKGRHRPGVVSEILKVGDVLNG